MPVQIDRQTRDVLASLVDADLALEADLPLLEGGGDGQLAERVRARGRALRRLAADLGDDLGDEHGSFELTMPPAELAAIIRRFYASSATWLADIVLELFQDDLPQVAREILACDAVLRQLSGDPTKSA